MLLLLYIIILNVYVVTDLSRCKQSCKEKRMGIPKNNKYLLTLNFVDDQAGIYAKKVVSVEKSRCKV